MPGPPGAVLGGPLKLPGRILKTQPKKTPKLKTKLKIEGVYIYTIYIQYNSLNISPSTACLGDGLASRLHEVIKIAGPH